MFGAKRGQVRFTIISVPLPERSVQSPLAARATAIGGPLVAGMGCIDAATAAADLIPPPPPPHDTFAIYAYGLVPREFAAAVQAQMVSRNVAPKLLAGLGARPRGYPQRVPIYLTTGNNEGLTAVLCGATHDRDGAIVAVDGGIGQTAATAAHELGHVYGRGLKLHRGVLPWFEDSVNEWFKWSLGYYEPKPRVWDVHLQYPEKPIDGVGERDRMRYAMWRFVQFLDDKQLWLGSDGSWPIARGVAAGGPAFAPAFDQLLAASGTRLGQELAAFWGEHLKARPKRPPTLVPAPANSQRVDVGVGTTTFTASACGLCTKLIDFQINDAVRRVEFEFEPPADGYFWGLTGPNESRRFEQRQTVSFCVGDANDDDLKWPDHFPVTFTNGMTDGSGLLGEIKIFAQTSTTQCQPAPTNRACRILVEAGARGVLGPFLFGLRGSSGVEQGRPYTLCSYTGTSGLGTLHIHRFRSSQDLRNWIRRKHRVAGWPYERIGDVAISFLAPGGKHAFLQFAIGRERFSLSVSSDRGPLAQVEALARGAAQHAR